MLPTGDQEAPWLFLNPETPRIYWECVLYLAIFIFVGMFSRDLEKACDYNRALHKSRLIRACCRHCLWLLPWIVAWSGIMALTLMNRGQHAERRAYAKAGLEYQPYTLLPSIYDAVVNSPSPSD